MKKKEKLNSINDALEVFEQSSIKHTTATLSGDYKTGNKAAKSIFDSINYLKENNEMDKLMPYLIHNMMGVRVWAASYILHFNPNVAVQTLVEISKGTDIISFNAEMTLVEWRKGNLKM